MAQPAFQKALQQGVDLVVRGLLEIVIPEANSLEWFRCSQADDVIGLGAQLLAR